ncbi:MAG: hypothetical protein V7L22_12215 [Nostoc sp.]|uniref:hypothetical protein n=1 Tax=Nostoc sp. TaxID=1180 RepID=UPI002FF5925D
MDSVRLDGELRFKAPDFKMLVRVACRRQDSLTLRYRGEEKFFPWLKPLTPFNEKFDPDVNAESFAASKFFNCELRIGMTSGMGYSEF